MSGFQSDDGALLGWMLRCVLILTECRSVQTGLLVIYIFIFVKYLRFDLRPGLELDLGFEENGDLRFENWQNDLNRLFERFEI